MKTLRAFATCCLLLAGTGFLSGCATTGRADVDASAQEAQNKQWDDMTTAQKVGYYLWWPVQWGLFWGGSALAGR
jgi:hypothetical protein